MQKRFEVVVKKSRAGITAQVKQRAARGSRVARTPVMPIAELSVAIVEEATGLSRKATTDTA